MAVTPAVFLDKDGTLVEDVPYNVDSARVRLGPGAEAAVRSLAAHGYRLIVVSNQGGVGLGRLRETDLVVLNGRLQRLLDGALAGFYYCTHHPRAGCDCRKPRPGLIFRAAAEQRLDLARSWMIGDILDDVEAGRRAGCRTCLIDNGNETEWKRGAAREPHHVAADLAAAAAHIVGR
ncbi:MAG: D-glycero-alpha-D-manno-heptose-1,7-bisphosphate 7-phosphatase [Clostridia bacterium]